MLRDRLKEARKLKGWRQLDLANESGISLSQARSLERSEATTPNPDVLKRLAAALEVSVDWILSDGTTAPIRIGRPRKSPPEESDLAPGGLISLPMLGDVAAGEPLEASVLGERLNFLELFGAPGLFAVRVRGDSMVDAGILDGDYVIIRRQPTAESGDIVLAWVRDGLTVKRYRERGGERWLHPHNTQAKPICLRENETVIYGVLAGLVRQM